MWKSSNSCASINSSQYCSGHGIACPPRSPPYICLVPAFPPVRGWQACCIRKYNYPCPAHKIKPRPLIRHTDFDLLSQYQKKLNIDRFFSTWFTKFSQLYKCCMITRYITRHKLLYLSVHFLDMILYKVFLYLQKEKKKKRKKNK